MQPMYEDRDLKLLVGGIVLIGIGWFLPGNPRLGGIVMLLGAVGLGVWTARKLLESAEEVGLPTA